MKPRQGVVRVGVAVFLIALPAFAQQAGPAVYRAAAKTTVREAAAALPSRRAPLGRPGRQALSALSGAELARPNLKPMLQPVGVHRPLPAEALAAGSWDVLPSGGRVWRMAVQSPDAAGIRFHFTDFAAGSGRLWVHDGAGVVIDGPYSAAGPFEDGDFWSGPVPGQEVVIEFEPAPAAGPVLPFRIPELSHLWDSPFAEAAPAGRLSPAPSPEPAGLQIGPVAPQAQAAACHQDVSCQSDWADTARAVGRIVFESAGSTYICSGTLVNTVKSSFVPYFLTAAHCLSTETEARTVQAAWFYQTSRCDGPAPSIADAKTTSGAHYMTGAGLGQGDFTLLRLLSVPDGVYFSGWDAAEAPVGSVVTAIHHPSGDYKRIATGSRIPDAQGLIGAPPENYYRVNFTSGRTETGSSGSGLFLSPGVLIGVLSSGSKPPAGKTVCDVDPFYSSYGRMPVLYPILRDYLEDRPPLTTPSPAPPPVEPPPPPPPPASQATPLVSGIPRTFNTPAVTVPTLLGGAAAYKIEVPNNATRLEIRVETATPNIDVDLYVRYGAEPQRSALGILADYGSISEGGNEVVIVTPPALKAGTYFIALSVYGTGRVAEGTVLAIVEAPGLPKVPSTATVLTSGTAASFSFPAVQTPTIFIQNLSFRIDVHPGAEQLSVTVTPANAAHVVDVYVRYGSSPVVENNRVTADAGNWTGAAGRRNVTITLTSPAPLRTGSYYVALAVVTTGVPVTGTILAEEGKLPRPPSSATVLSSGMTRSFSTPPVSVPGVLGGANSFQIEVPFGAERLEIKLASNTPNMDIELYARYDSEVVYNQTVDGSATGPGANKTINITSPRLRAGKYFIALYVLTSGRSADCQITATIYVGSSYPGSGAPQTLQPGMLRSYSLPAVGGPTLFLGDYGYKVSVREGASRLEIRLTVNEPGVNVELHVRYGRPPEVSGAGGGVAADHTTRGTNSRTLVVLPTSTPPLRAGDYYIALTSTTAGRIATGTVIALVTAPPSTTAVPMTAGTPAKFNLPAVSGPTLFTGGYAFRFNVAEGSTRLQIRMSTTSPDVDVDMYVRYGEEPIIDDNGRVVADYRGISETGDESVSIDLTSSPPLRAGVYYIALVLWTPQTAASGNITAIADRSTDKPPSIGNVLTPGTTAEFSFPAVAQPTLFNDDRVFRIEVPAGATALEVRAASSTADADVDLYVRYGNVPDVSGGRAVADWRAAGDPGPKLLRITPGSSPPLRPGVYFIGIAVTTIDVPVSGTVVANMEGAFAGKLRQRYEVQSW